MTFPERFLHTNGTLGALIWCSRRGDHGSHAQRNQYANLSKLPAFISDSLSIGRHCDGQSGAGAATARRRLPLRADPVPRAIRTVPKSAACSQPRWKLRNLGRARDLRGRPGPLAAPIAFQAPRLRPLCCAGDRLRVPRGWTSLPRYLPQDLRSAARFLVGLRRIRSGLILATPVANYRRPVFASCFIA